MTGDPGVPGRRKQAQVLGTKAERSDAARGEHSGPSDPEATDIRVEDLGNGRARLSLELSWALALKVLDFLKDIADRRNH